MIDVTPETKDAASSATATVDSSASSNKEDGTSFTERYSEVLGKVNETLDQVDWNQMGRISKIVGIFAAVIIIQILIKGILDTINLLPIIPGLLNCSVWLLWASGAGRISQPARNAPLSFREFRLFGRNIWAEQFKPADDSDSADVISTG